MRAKLINYETLFDRRRARQRRGDAGRTYTFELAALHLELLVAMAAVDGEIHRIEMGTVLGFIDRTALSPDERERLDQLAQSSFRSPPQLRAIVGQLSAIARKPAVARRVVEDLAKVAAADRRADPREIALLEFVCRSLNVPMVPIRVEDEPDASASRLPERVVPTRREAYARAEHVAASRRVRSAVRSALEASYESRDSHFG